MREKHHSKIRILVRSLLQHPFIFSQIVDTKREQWESIPKWKKEVIATLSAKGEACQVTGGSRQGSPTYGAQVQDIRSQFDIRQDGCHGGHPVCSLLPRQHAWPCFYGYTNERSYVRTMGSWPLRGVFVRKKKERKKERKKGSGSWREEEVVAVRKW